MAWWSPPPPFALVVHLLPVRTLATLASTCGAMRDACTPVLRSVCRARAHVMHAWRNGDRRRLPLSIIVDAMTCDGAYPRAQSGKPTSLALVVDDDGDNNVKLLNVTWLRLSAQGACCCIEVDDEIMAVARVISDEIKHHVRSFPSPRRRRRHRWKQQLWALGVVHGGKKMQAATVFDHANPRSVTYAMCECRGGKNDGALCLSRRLARRLVDYAAKRNANTPAPRLNITSDRLSCDNADVALELALESAMRSTSAMACSAVLRRYASEIYGGGGDNGGKSCKAI